MLNEFSMSFYSILIAAAASLNKENVYQNKLLFVHFILKIFSLNFWKNLSNTIQLVSVLFAARNGSPLSRPAFHSNKTALNFGTCIPFPVWRYIKSKVFMDNPAKIEELLSPFAKYHLKCSNN